MVAAALSPLLSTCVCMKSARYVHIQYADVLAYMYIMVWLFKNLGNALIHVHRLMWMFTGGVGLRIHTHLHYKLKLMPNVVNKPYFFTHAQRERRLSLPPSAVDSAVHLLRTDHANWKENTVPNYRQCFP